MSAFHERTQTEQLKLVGRTAVGSQSGMICEDLHVTGTGFKNYLTHDDDDDDDHDDEDNHYGNYDDYDDNILILYSRHWHEHIWTAYGQQIESFK